MEEIYKISNESAAREITLKNQGSPNTVEASSTSLLDQMHKSAPFDSDWLPPGLRSFTRAGEHSQAVLVAPPAVNRVMWGEVERDRNVKQYLLAQPWRVIITDMLGEQHWGTRMFYSPTPINSPEQVLYHQNLPNINCLGYRGNGVGWVCLYANNDWKGSPSLGEKLYTILERCSGAEAYNNQNMEGIDGPSMYKKYKMPKYTWDPVAWEEKTTKEGVMWTFDESLWIPVLVKSKEDQRQHLKKGIPLTLEMAMNGNYASTYGAPKDQKPATKLRNKEDIAEHMWTWLRGSFARAIEE